METLKESVATNNRIGVTVKGIVTPIIQPGDDLEDIVVSFVGEAIGGTEISDGDIVAVTEAVLAISQNNFVTAEDIAKDISRLYGEEIALIDPIQSRNRFLEILKAIALTPTLKKIYIFMTYPCDEVGNELISEEEFCKKKISRQAVMSVENLYEIFGKPAHPFTGINYIEEYEKACNGKAEIILCNDFTNVPYCCKDVLICSIHRRNIVRNILEKNGAEVIHDLSEIMAESIDGSGYNKKYGLYGSNKMAENLKLMPRDCEVFVQNVQDMFLERYGKKVEVLVFGDGAFKDPLGGIWELADPETTLAATDGLLGTPTEVKLKYLMSKNQGKTSKEIEEIVAKEKQQREGKNDESALGTTPRRITDLVASLCDLTVGSGDRQTPVVYISNYLR